MSEQLAQLERELEARDLLNLRGLISFGQEVEAFMKSPIGRYIVACAARDIEQARDEFQNVDPHDTKAIVAAQIRAKVPAAVMAWLGHAVQSGQIAATNAINAEAQQG
jgi:hypothetical protein